MSMIDVNMIREPEPDDEEDQMSVQIVLDNQHRRYFDVYRSRICERMLDLEDFSLQEMAVVAEGRPIQEHYTIGDMVGRDFRKKVSKPRLQTISGSQEMTIIKSLF